jgi:hypothetical protein
MQIPVEYELNWRSFRGGRVHSQLTENKDKHPFGSLELDELEHAPLPTLT